MAQPQAINRQASLPDSGSPTRVTALMNTLKRRFGSPQRSPAGTPKSTATGNESMPSTPGSSWRVEAGRVGSATSSTGQHSSWKFPSYSHSKQKRERIRELEEQLSATGMRIARMDPEMQRLHLEGELERKRVREWREHWQYQNFKSSLLVDMMVAQVVEAGHSSVRGPRKAGGGRASLGPSSAAARQPLQDDEFEDE